MSRQALAHGEIMRWNKPLSERVIVVTGASSGIGMATAMSAAASGARVVMVARGEADITLVRACIENGEGKATHVVADVGDSDDVRKVAAHAIETFGGFDTWVSVAGLTIYGTLAQVSEADDVKLMQTNFRGPCTVRSSPPSTCASTAARSSTSAVWRPTSRSRARGMYVASKHVVKVFTDTLRMELLEEGAPINVTLLKPIRSTPLCRSAHATTWTKNRCCRRRSTLRRRSPTPS